MYTLSILAGEMKFFTGALSHGKGW